MRDHIYFQVSVFLLFRSMPKSRIAGSHYCSIFNFSQNLHIIFNSTYTNLHSYQQWTSVPFFPHLRQNLFLVLLTTTFLKNMWWYHIVVLICISLMVNNVEHLFMYLVSHLYVFLEKNLFRYSHHFVRYFFFFAIELYELVGCHFLLQRIFSTQVSNWHLLHWQVDSLLVHDLGSPLYFEY